MPTSKKNLRSAPTENRPPVKPAPPSPDVWDQLEAIEKETMVIRPPGSFTIPEYAAKRGINRNKAAHQLARLAELGRVTRVRPPNSTTVYWSIV